MKITIQFGEGVKEAEEANKVALELYKLGYKRNRQLETTIGEAVLIKEEN